MKRCVITTHLAMGEERLSMEATDSPRSGTRGKVQRLLDTYDLEGEGERLEDYWVGESGPRRSLRQLADYLNVEIVETAMRRAGAEVLHGEAENVYRLLTDDDVSRGVSIETRNQLRGDGVDVEELERDLVSRQAVHTYLTKVRGVEYAKEDTTSADRIERREQTIQRLKSRLSVVAAETLDNLRQSGDLAVGETDVLVSVDVHCSDCQEQYEITDLFAERSCNCPNGPT